MLIHHALFLHNLYERTIVSMLHIFEYIHYPLLNLLTVCTLPAPRKSINYFFKIFIYCHNVTEFINCIYNNSILHL